jgi:hypothetical protein
MVLVLIATALTGLPPAIGYVARRDSLPWRTKVVPPKHLSRILSPRPWKVVLPKHLLRIPLAAASPGSTPEPGPARRWAYPSTQTLQTLSWRARVPAICLAKHSQARGGAPVGVSGPACRGHAGVLGSPRGDRPEPGRQLAWATLLRRVFAVAGPV